MYLKAAAKQNYKWKGWDTMNRTAIVTGGADGIGKEIVLELLAHGYAVAALDISQEKLDSISAQLAGKPFLALKCDVTDEASVDQTFAQVTAHFGRLDVLVNNAGGSLAISQPIDQIPVQGWDKVIALNLRGTFLCTRAAVRVMREQKYGRIVNMSSMAGRSRSVFGGAPYAAAKAAIIGLTRQSSKDLGPIGVTINAIAPGTVISGDRISSYWANKTPEDKKRFFDSNPAGRLGEPADISRAVLFLCDEGASFINGAVLDVNGGMWVG